MSVSVSPTPYSTSVESFIGNTPLLPISHSGSRSVKIAAKLEWQQLGGSVKARAAYRIIRDAMNRGELGNGRRLLDATSGNTGIAYASILSRLGLPLTLFVPENASEERKTLFKALGAEVRYTSKYESTEGSQEAARDLADAHPEHYFYADQYSNPSNWKAHYESTADEIWKQTNGQITHFVAGLGTTGTFTGTGRRLKELNPDIQLVALQPDGALHGLEGWKHLESAGAPAIYDYRLADQFLNVRTEDAYQTIRQAAQDEGVMLSPSSAANLFGARQVAAENRDGFVVTVFPDDASKYGTVIKDLF